MIPGFLCNGEADACFNAQRYRARGKEPHPQGCGFFCARSAIPGPLEKGTYGIQGSTWAIAQGGHMTSRERVRIVLEGGVPDRVPFQDAYWETTVERWRTEGMPADVSPEDYFGCEIVKLGGDYTLQLPEQVIEETDRYRIYKDSNGATRKDLNTADGWTPSWLGFTIKGREDWEAVRDQAGFRPSRIAKGILERYRSARDAGKFVAFGAHACFHPTWQKIGMEEMFIWMQEDPEFVSDLYAIHTKLIIDLFDGIRAKGVEFDGAWLSDDLGYRNAPLISPKMYRNLVKPHHKRLCDHFAELGLRTIFHSDGNVGPLIPDFIDAGFRALNPLEAKAHLDVSELKAEYGKDLVLFGNIDVRKLVGTRSEIEEEIATKVCAGKVDGGYIYHSDHSVPNDVSLENYRFALEMLKKYGTCNQAKRDGG